MTDPIGANELGRFLRACRGRVSPTAIGFGGAVRRIDGLRREEVAVLAGMSADYYARLEQGRETNPSVQILDALARILRLDPNSRQHLFRLAGRGSEHGSELPSSLVAPALLELVHSFSNAAAYVLGPSLDILARNEAAAALLAPFDGTSTNMLRIFFEHPDAAEVFELPKLTRAAVYALRLNSGHYPDDEQIQELVKHLSETSAEFRALWGDYAVGALTRQDKVFIMPKVGRIELAYQTFDVPDAPGQQLLVGTPKEDGRSSRALAVLVARMRLSAKPPSDLVVPHPEA